MRTHPRRPDFLSAADATPGPRAADEPHPTVIRTPAARPRRARRLCRGTSPGRSRYSFVPRPVAIQKTLSVIRFSAVFPAVFGQKSLLLITSKEWRAHLPPGTSQLGTGPRWGGASG